MLLCDNCKNSVGNGYFHPLKDEIWILANGKEKGLLCLNCIEIKLNRKLNEKDFYFPDSFMKLKRKGIL